MTPLGIEEIQSILGLLDVRRLEMSLVFDDELFEVQEGPLVGNLLADLHTGSPGMGRVGLCTVGALRTDTPPACSIGVKLQVFHAGSNEYREAEILSMQTRPTGVHYYVHYTDFNKRLDEWVTLDKLDLTKEVEWPKPPEPPAPPVSSSHRKKDSISKNSKASRPQKHDGDDGHKSDSMDVDDPTPTDDTKLQEPANFSKEKEIEKLRTSGSMTQSAHEISRVRNLSRLQIGLYELEPWYFSPYPPELTSSPILHICEFCLSYFGCPTRFLRHRQKCDLFHPPGNEIYRDQAVSFFEIDGRRQRTWCRNLCLLSKCFLDHKTLYYDVDPFLFYCMCVRDDRGFHLVGYFSKEKESADGYNVACILTLPQYQRTGYGKLLIAFSYELSKREGKLGSPEKPLSDLGLLSYRAYWQDTIVDILLEQKGEVTIDELANMSAMTTNDVIHTLQTLGMIRYYKGQHVICLTDAILAQKEKLKERQRIKGKRVLDPSCLQWKPPVFTAATRTWNW
ncbi:hypothetical protein BJ508DRAFT_369776 [Ascobolus immersus RN42]|uniref:Histone acetyltransferase ESA1 n=1 Tax=Ascobolus immersus RN42 TaxID=1160509 RepID=A0A3N4IBQ5_ASCIM|nr:hypothetical protein BJ508DRAFT_369776 [Ascobolus immersus RN42]